MRHLLLSAALAALTLTATAQTPIAASATVAETPSWNLRTFDVYEAADRRKPVEERRIRYSGVMVHTTDTTRPGALFSCSAEQGLSVMFSLEGVDFADADYFASSQLVRSMIGRLIVDGDRPRDSSRFLYRPRLKVAQAARPEVAHSAVSALYLGQTTEVEVGGLRPVSVSLPGPDDTFREFVAACPSFIQD